MTGYAVLFLDSIDGELEYGPWWTAYASEWPIEASSAERAIAQVRERLCANGESDSAETLIAIPYNVWSAAERKAAGLSTASS